MTKEEFKKRWESNDDGGSITFNDIADCAIEWGITSKPRIMPMAFITYMALKAADVSDADNQEEETTINIDHEGDE